MNKVCFGFAFTLLLFFAALCVPGGLLSPTGRLKICSGNQQLYYCRTATDNSSGC